MFQALDFIARNSLLGKNCLESNSWQVTEIMPNKTTKTLSCKRFTQAKISLFKVSKTFFDVTAEIDLVQAVKFVLSAVTMKR